MAGEEGGGSDVTQPGDRPALIELLARRFHDTYERLAPEYGWQTQEATRAKPWGEVPEHNRRLMVATVEVLVDTGWIEVGPAAMAGFELGYELGLDRTTAPAPSGREPAHRLRER